MTNIDLMQYNWNDSWAEMPQSDLSENGWAHSGMAIRENGEIITADSGESRIIIYDSEGSIINSWQGNFTHAHGITLSYDDNGNEVLWIADNGSRKEQIIGYKESPGNESKSGRVFKTTLCGDELIELSAPIHKAYEKIRYAPTAVIIDEKSLGGNGDIWVADGYGANLVHQYNQKGNFIKTIDGSNAAGSFKCPHGISIDRRKPIPELYIADRVNKRVQVFNLAGVFLRSFGEDFLSTPSGFATLGDNLVIAELRGRLTITDINDDFLGYLFNNEGVEKTPGWPNTIDSNGVISKTNNLSSDKLNSPHGIVTDDIGNIYITEWLIGGRIIKLSPKSHVEM